MDVVKTRFGSINTCGRAERTAICELDMGPESETGGIDAILGMDVLGRFRIALGGLAGTSSMGRRTPE